MVWQRLFKKYASRPEKQVTMIPTRLNTHATFRSIKSGSYDVIVLIYTLVPESLREGEKSAALLDLQPVVVDRVDIDAHVITCIPPHSVLPLQAEFRMRHLAEVDRGRTFCHGSVSGA
eukprot:3502926-Prymnesium_polylepis.1